MKPSSVPAEKKETTEETQERKPITKRVIRKTGSGYTPSIKDALSGRLHDDKVEDAKEKMKFYTGEELKEPFTKEQFEAKWSEYLKRLDERPGLKATLSKTPEIVNDHQLKLSINNSLQEEDINTIKPDLVAWLRKELRNTRIELITEILVSEDQTYRPKTETEKFQEMRSKNPTLNQLVEKFNLNLGE